MFLARRTSGRQVGDFPVGSRVVARPATASRAITGIVVATSGEHTLTVRDGELEILLDVEDCIAPGKRFATEDAR